MGLLRRDRLADKLLKVSRSLQRPKLQHFDIRLTQAQLQGRLADREIKQKTAGQHLAIMRWEGLQETMHPLDRSDAERGQLALGGTLPAGLEQRVERTRGDAIARTPVIGDGCAGNLEEPLLHAQRPPLGVHAAHRLEKDLRGQILGLLAVAHFAINIAIDQAEVLLVERLKLLCLYFRLFRHELRLISLSAQSAHALPLRISCLSE